MRTTERKQLDLVHEEVNGLIDQSQDLSDTQRNFASEMGFSCPVEQSTGPGRPRFYIPQVVIRGLHDVHGVWKEVPKEASASYKTILRRGRRRRDHLTCTQNTLKH